jgi:uncharacterized protein (TIGR03067 family)
MRRQAISLALLTGVLVAPIWANDKAAEDEKLYGAWEMTLVAVSGKEIPSPDPGAAFVFAKGGKTFVESRTGTGDPGGYTTAPGGEGKPFREIAMFDVKDGKPVLRGIYRIEGDHLTMVFPVKDEKSRPASLDAKDAYIVTFKRQKP